MSLTTHAEQLFSPVLEQAANRSASSWIHCVRAACASDCASASEAVRWSSCAFASKAARTGGYVSSCTQEAARESSCAARICFYETPRLIAMPSFGVALSSCSKAARTKRSLTSKRYGLAKLARKIVVEILFRQVFLKFYFTKF